MKWTLESQEKPYFIELGGDWIMKILKTSEQAKKEQAAKEAALKEMYKCPECGSNTRWTDIESFLHNYRCTCAKCGCEWESSEF